MYTSIKQAGLIGAACCGIASAQGTMTFYWDINDTGSDFFLYSGEAVINFKLYASMDPEQVGFAGSIYEILGGDEFGSAGVVTLYDNKLDSLTDDGELQGNNDILDIESFQLPPFFNPDFDSSNPILLYEINWEVADFFMIATLSSANYLNSAVYTDDLGSSEQYDAITTTATVLIPAPASVLPFVGLLAWRRRR